MIQAKPRRLGVTHTLIDGRLMPADVEIADGVVTRIVEPSPGAEGIAAPGFVDLQVNGCAGIDFYAADADGWRQAGAALLRCGVTAFLPTFISAAPETIRAALASLPRIGVGPRVLGAHVEGPFLSPERPGTHPVEFLRPPDAALLGQILDAGPVCLMTLAPELAGASRLIDDLRARGVVVSAGHSCADAATAHAAFDRGVGAVTHLFNAMPPLGHREAGLAGAALAREDVIVQLIADGHHVADDVLRVAWNAAGGRVALVSDAAAPAGAPDGDYEIGGVAVRSQGGVVRNVATGGLAGSALMLDAAVRRMVALGASAEDALGAATTVPARLLGRTGIGAIAPGRPADIVVLDEQLEVRRTLVGGVDAWG